MEEWGFAAGDEVLLRGLSKLELNGQHGTVLPVESAEQARQLGRLPVMLHTGKQLSLKVVNLVKVGLPHRSPEGSEPLHLTSKRKLRSAAKEGAELVVMTFNLQYLASFPQDPNVARRRLLEITQHGARPDIIAVQEALEGIDLLAQVGYTKLISSAVKAAPLRDALYGDENALNAVPSVAHESLLVNELYIRNEAECRWEVISTGVEEISSSLTVSIGDELVPLTPRAVVWAKLCLKGTEGPGARVFVMNTQLSGCRVEDELILAHLKDERSRQVARAVDLFGQHASEEDVALLVGDFGAVSGPMSIEAPESAQAPLETLEDLGWSLAYDQQVVPASCFFGHLSDFMVTSRKVHPLLVETMQTANVIGEAQLDVPLSDHQAVKAVFSLESLQSLRTTAVPGAEAEMPILGLGSHFLPEELANERLSDDEFYARVDTLTQTAVKDALEAGVRLFDSSNDHQNQQSLGLALQKEFEKGLSRNDVFVCGRIRKCKDKEHIRQEVLMLLSELRLDYVDCLIADGPPEQVPAAWPHLEEVVREGRCRFLGVSNFDLLGPKVGVEVFRHFLSRSCWIPPAVMALEVHPLNTNLEMCELCDTMGIQVLAYSPLGSPGKVESFMQVLSKSDAREMRPLLKVPDLELLQQLSQRHDKTPAQVALRWNLQRKHCVVPKSWNRQHILENTQLFDFHLSSEEMAKITKLHKGVRAERFYQASFTASKALPQMTRDAFDECQEVLKKIRGPKGTVIAPCPVGDAPLPLPMDIAQKGGHDLTNSKVDWEKLGFHRPVEEEPGFWRRMGLATGKGIEGGKGKGKRFPLLKDGLPVGGKGVTPHPAMAGYR